MENLRRLRHGEVFLIFMLRRRGIVRPAQFDTSRSAKRDASTTTKTETRTEGNAARRIFGRTYVVIIVVLLDVVVWGDRVSCDIADHAYTAVQ